VTRTPLPDGVTECTINRCATLAVTRVGVDPYCKTHGYFARRRNVKLANTASTRNAHQPINYADETIRLVVRQWAAIRRAGTNVDHIALATALDNLLEEYRQR
jgi:hypothetical protein